MCVLDVSCSFAYLHCDLKANFREMSEKPFKGKVVLVTGSNRGIGRGIACEFGTAGATVYVTARKDDEDSLEEVVKEIKVRGGNGHAIYCDHSQPSEIKKLFEQIENEQNGQLDVLVNNAHEGIEFVLKHLGTKFFEYSQPPEYVFDLQANVGLRGVYVASFYASKSKAGIHHTMDVSYGATKTALDRLSADCAIELHPHNVTVISLWPGATHTETMSGNFVGGDSNAKNIYQSIYYSGRILVQLLQTSNLHDRTGQILTTNLLGNELGVKDVDGTTPRDTKIDQYLEFIDVLNKVRCKPMASRSS
ncbi:hypothetical protein M3Y96_01205200 [Aphelenchoides besseyi]|nr:hypothetical protein M3Y96_01205200 [Aphelenchoides besseyi]